MSTKLNGNRYSAAGSRVPTDMLPHARALDRILPKQAFQLFS